MTSPETSEEEIEAARKALRDRFDIWMSPISMGFALAAAARVREIDWKARAAEIRTDEGDELDEVYATLGIGGNFSAIDEIKRLQAAAQVRATENNNLHDCVRMAVDHLRKDGQVSTAQVLEHAALSIRKGE